MNDGDMQKNTEEVPFVPYVAEAFAGDDDKRKKKRMLFIPLIIAVVLGLIYLIMTMQKKNNFYQKTLADLSFDYRNGETVLDDDDSIKPGALASEISESIQNHGVSIDTVSYYLNRDRTLSNDIAEYQFTRSGEGDTAEITIGTVDAISSSTETVRRTGSGTKILKHGDWENAAGIALPMIYEFCFLSESNSRIDISCDSAYETFVGSKKYTCEIWLMQSGGTYFTLYRYYNGGTLKAVRVLNSNDDLMCVYEIKDYSTL